MEKVYAADNMGIDCTSEKLANGQCTMKTYEMLWIRKDAQESDPEIFIQDVFLWATMFIWTMTAIWILISWFLMIMAAWNEKMAEKWKSWMKYSIYGMLLVIFSYTIIRLVQFIAKG